MAKLLSKGDRCKAADCLADLARKIRCDAARDVEFSQEITPDGVLVTCLLSPAVVESQKAVVDDDGDGGASG